MLTGASDPAKIEEKAAEAKAELTKEAAKVAEANEIAAPAPVSAVPEVNVSELMAKAKLTEEPLDLTSLLADANSLTTKPEEAIYLET